MNNALVFLKPHAVTEAAKGFLRSFLLQNHCQIVNEGTLTSDVIESKGIIDSHYAALAANALKVLPSELPVTAEIVSEFAAKYGETWSDASKGGKLLNLAQYISQYPGQSMKEIEAAWRAGPTLKLSPGTYISRINDKSYVVNGFYGSMREKFVAPGALVAWYSVQFKEADLSWKDFRARVIGATDPSKAHVSSLRYRFRSNWQDLGLQFEPTTADNSVHASAGPIEALRERITWLGIALESDEFGQQLLGSGLSRELVDKVCNNATITLADGRKGPAFDLLEDLNTSEVIPILRSIA